MRFDIRYLTCFSYPEAVRESHNVLRACPMSDPRQELLSYRVSTTPASRVFSYVDYWGTRVDSFGVRRAHPRLEVVAEMVVDTEAPALPAWAAAMASGEGTADAGVTRAALAAPDFARAHLEYLEPSPHVRWDAELRRRAEEWIAGVGDDAGGAIGVPARYVSGYLFSDSSTRGELPPGGVVDVKTHAWVEVALPGDGWVPLDPTTQRPVGERHVKIGHGRDYDDVLPLRGVYHGDAEHQLDVVVRMRELASSQQQ